MLTVLGVDVSPDLLDRWVDWLAPDEQPFFVTKRQATAWKLATDDREPSREDHDTYRTYRVDRKAARTAWLSEAAYGDLPKATRAALVRAQVDYDRGAVPTVRRWAGIVGPEVRQQADGHRFVWWKSLLREPARVLPDVVSEDLGPSRHAEVRTWPAELPRVRELAGTFADGSGPNCFGTVMAACGIEGAETVWMLREPFDEWLANHTERGGQDDVPGTVFVWRDTARLVQHAALTIGDGWMFHKPSQSWMSPRKVRTLAEVKRATRTAGWRLERHRLVG
ncbi:hypothetical protein EV651_12780 [Kribbella sp. VKM Ac-2571]|uniref:hypothetical protein n=1 Tax=Kribbella sp. VKM Ac-2571 TaxID=2512222 RepID=UPI0010DA0134|nr:hypothetical protein [Kribbella sp. VKM Ac-2571]TDO46118.1 hypothetical protein EV651_12780 [Kribbella sp. VKM Ac-2571]